MKKDTRQKVLFITIFALIGFGAMQVPFSELVGGDSGLKFNLFDFYGPIAGGFIGSALGLVTVGLMQLFGWAYNGFPTELGSLIRLLPVLFAVLYFAKQTTKWSLIAPAVAMIAFWAHPEGRQAWYFALYWTIPFIMYAFRDRFLFARALGSTFTQHSVGGALWIWAFGTPASVWTGILLPIVWRERLIMALGITLTYMFFTYLMSVLREKTSIKIPFVQLNPKYSLKHKPSA